MEKTQEKRTCNRYRHTVPIAVSYFNQAQYFNAQIQNHSPGGMCFKSNYALQPGTVVYIRVKKVHPNGSSTGIGEGLRMVTLAKVKWCMDEPDAPAYSYRLGVKYFEEAY